MSRCQRGRRKCRGINDCSNNSNRADVLPEALRGENQLRCVPGFRKCSDQQCRPSYWWRKNATQGEIAEFEGIDFDDLDSEDKADRIDVYRNRLANHPAERRKTPVQRRPPADRTRRKTAADRRREEAENRKKEQDRANKLKSDRDLRNRQRQTRQHNEEEERRRQLSERENERLERERLENERKERERIEREKLQKDKDKGKKPAGDPPRRSDRRASALRYIAVRGDGNCFFYALYMSATERVPPIDLSLLHYRDGPNTINFQTAPRMTLASRQLAFSNFMRGMLHNSNDYRDRLIDQAATIQNWSHLLMIFAALHGYHLNCIGLRKRVNKQGVTSIFFDPAINGIDIPESNPLHRLVPATSARARVIATYRLPDASDAVFLEGVDPNSRPRVLLDHLLDYKDQILQKAYWVSAIEVGACAHFLNQFNITLTARNDFTLSFVNDDPNRARTVYVQTNGDHYSAVLPSN